MSSHYFNIIYADPPWQFKLLRPFGPLRQGQSYDTQRMLPYPSMSTEEISAIPVAPICDPDCVLFLWATYPMLPDALKVISAWGFEFKTVGFTWVKRTRRDRTFHFGMGYWTRSNPELCLLATRGRPHRISKRVANLVISPLREHSRKPDEVRERIVELCGDLPRAELFAREKAPGWCAWGNEVSCDFALPQAVVASPQVTGRGID